MDSLHKHWKRLPGTVRKPLVLTVGLLFIIAAGLTGWLPGPGGIPLFLVGIAILATEFEWAQRVRDWALGWVHQLGQWWRRHKFIGTLAIIAGIAVVFGLGYVAYRFVRSLL